MVVGLNNDPKHIFKHMDKNIITILASKVYLHASWPMIFNPPTIHAVVKGNILHNE